MRVSEIRVKRIRVNQGLGVGDLEGSCQEFWLFFKVRKSNQIRAMKRYSAILDRRILIRRRALWFDKGFNKDITEQLMVQNGTK